MPTYVYHCSTCDKTYEIEQRITEDALTDCQCGGKRSMKRVIQPVAVAFKGAGFHINDYAAKPAPESSTESKAETKAESPTESKTETKTDAAASTSTPAPAPAPKAD